MAHDDTLTSKKYHDNQPAPQSRPFLYIISLFSDVFRHTLYFTYDRLSIWEGNTFWNGFQQSFYSHCIQHTCS